MRNKAFIKVLLRGAVVTILTVGLIACGDSDNSTHKLPEQVAEEFVDAIYNTKDIEVVKSLSTSKVNEIVNHYRSIKMIQRHIMDLSLDSAKIGVTNVGGDFFRKTRKDLTVELYIDGKSQGHFVADDRFLLMTFEDNRWKVKRISKS